MVQDVCVTDRRLPRRRRRSALWLAPV